MVSLVRRAPGESGFGFSSTAEQVTRGLELRGKRILVTGVNSGLGAESARVLAERGARIFGAARSRDKAKAACASLAHDAVPLECELSEPDSVRACVDEVKALGVRLDVLMCNAGIMALPERTVVHGLELQFLTNHVGHFILVTGLLDRLADDARVVVLSSAAHVWAPREGIRFDDLSFERDYSPRGAYGHSKLANLLFARALARRFEGTKKTANAVHPGVIATNLVRHMNPVVRAFVPLASAIAFKTVPQGAATQCYVAVHPAVAGVSGEYFADCNRARSTRASRNVEMGERLWEVTERLAAEL